MKNYRDLTNAFSQLIWVGQLGLDLLMPLLLCLGLCWWLNARLGVGAWVYIPGFVLGLSGGFASAYSFYRITVKKQQQKTSRQAYNRHE